MICLALHVNTLSISVAVPQHLFQVPIFFVRWMKHNTYTKSHSLHKKRVTLVLFKRTVYLDSNISCDRTAWPTLKTTNQCSKKQDSVREYKRSARRRPVFSEAVSVTWRIFSYTVRTSCTRLSQPFSTPDPPFSSTLFALFLPPPQPLHLFYIMSFGGGPGVEWGQSMAPGQKPYLRLLVNWVTSWNM